MPFNYIIFFERSEAQIEFFLKNVENIFYVDEFKQCALRHRRSFKYANRRY